MAKNDPGPPNDRRPVLLFDGVCNLCNGAVQFIIRRDAASNIRFASQQSEAGRHLLRMHGLADDGAQSPESLVLVEGDRAYRHSAAVLRAARYLRQPWPLAYAFIAVPSFLRDALYRFIARNRYRWFGRRESCMLPAPALRERFLEAVDDLRR